MFNQKIGKLIQAVRIQRGLTQTQLAKIVNTSQSAINRIEKGGQNLSLATIENLSEALQQPLIHLNQNCLNLQVSGGRQLSGKVQLATSSRSCLNLLLASLINHSKTKIIEAPKTVEVLNLISLLEKIGVEAKWQQTTLEIKRPDKINLEKISEDPDQSYLRLIFPLLTEFSKFEIHKSQLNDQENQLLEAGSLHFKKVGILIKSQPDYYQIKTIASSQDVSISFGEESLDLIIGLIIVASQRSGRTRFQTVPIEPEIEAVCSLLKGLGVNISGTKTTTLTIEGSEQKIAKTVEARLTKDPTEALFFLTVAIVNGANITIEDFPIRFLEEELDQLQTIGQKLEVIKVDDRVDLVVGKQKSNLESLPSTFITKQEFLPFMGMVAAVGKGFVCFDFDLNVAKDCQWLRRVGVEIRQLKHHQIITGSTNFRPAKLNCLLVESNLVLSLLAATLAATGISYLKNVSNLQYDYNDLIEKLNLLGADIEVLVNVS